MRKSWQEDLHGEEIWASSVSLDEGILAKYGRVFGNREHELKKFQKHYDVLLPTTFLDYIGEYCEAGFDGCYRVLKLPQEYLTWWHLLLMRLPTKDDSDIEKYFVDSALLSNKKLFLNSKDKSLRYFPFGEASIFHLSEDASVKGYLSFDTKENYSVVFLAPSNGRTEQIAKSFKAMIDNANFIHFG